MAAGRRTGTANLNFQSEQNKSGTDPHTQRTLRCADRCRAPR